MARPTNTAQRRHQIAMGLRKVMSKKGYDGASIGDVARAAKLTPGLVHYHFQSKREILLAVLDGLVADHAAGLDQALAAAAGDPAREVEAFIDFHLALGASADAEALGCWITLSAEALREPKVKVAYAAALTASLERLCDVIARGALAKQFRLADERAAASALLATIQGYFVLAATARALVPPGSAAGAARRMANGLLQPKRPFGGERAR